jgi:excisionase family DNA binding protein
MIRFVCPMGVEEGKKRIMALDSFRPAHTPIYRVPEVARLLGCTEASVRHMIARGQLPARRQGGRVFVLAEDLREYLRALPARRRTEAKP